MSSARGGWKQGCSPGWRQGWAGPAAFEDGATLPGPWSQQEAGGLTPSWGPARRKSLLSRACAAARRSDLSGDPEGQAPFPAFLCVVLLFCFCTSPTLASAGPAGRCGLGAPVRQPKAASGGRACGSRNHFFKEERKVFFKVFVLSPSASPLRFGKPRARASNCGRGSLRPPVLPTASWGPGWAGAKDPTSEACGPLTPALKG